MFVTLRISVRMGCVRQYGRPTSGIRQRRTYELEQIGENHEEGKALSVQFSLAGEWEREQLARAFRWMAAMLKERDDDTRGAKR